MSKGKPDESPSFLARWEKVIQEMPRLPREAPVADRPPTLFVGDVEYVRADVVEGRVREAIESEEQNPWKEAIITEMVLWETLPTEGETPREALNRMIAWEQTVALDPRVSEDARNLIEAEREACAVQVDGYLMTKTALPVEQIVDLTVLIRTRPALASPSDSSGDDEGGGDGG